MSTTGLSYESPKAHMPAAVVGPKPPTAPPATSPVLAAANKATNASGSDATASYKLYSYYGDRYRDPFIPLLGEVRYDQSLDRPPQITSLLLKGIVQDEKGRIALLTSGLNSYLLRGGRLYDGRNRMVKGISGIVKSTSVILIGSDRTVRELKEKQAL